MEETGEPRSRLLYLESLRGIAAVVVVFSHFAEAFFPAAVHDDGASLHNRIEPLLHNTPLGILLAGNFGVCLFFAMSGYVLVRPFFQSRRYDLLASAATRRYFRLMPPVAVSILVAYLLLRMGWFTNQGEVAVTGSHWLSALWPFTPNLRTALYEAFIGAFSNPVVTYNPLLWTMRTEFLGSLLIFAVVGLTGGLTRRWVIYIVLAAIFSQSYFLGFIGGMVLADYMSLPGHNKSTMARLKPHFLALLMLGGLLLGAYPSDQHVSSTLYRGFTIPHFNATQLMSLWHTVGALFVLASILYWPGARRWLSHAWLVSLGKLSFSLYLSHMIILCTLGTSLFARFHTYLGYKISVLLTFIVTAAGILAVSGVLTRYVDAPSIRWAKSIGKWLAGAPAVKFARSRVSGYGKIEV